MMRRHRREMERMAWLGEGEGDDDGDDDGAAAEGPALVEVAARRGGVDALALLLAAGAAPARALSEAAKALSSGPVAPALACMRALLAAGAEVGAKDGRGRTARHHAATGCGHLGAVRLLLAAGAAAGARDADGATPHDLAARDGNRAAAEELRNESRLARLVSRMGSRDRRARTVAGLADEALCCVCRALPREVIIAPCGHRATCKRCLRKILSLSDPAAHKCPLCTGAVESFVVQVFE
jgi:ankyrin repeat protein